MAEPTAHTEAPGGKTAFPPFQTQTFPSQLVWLAISFVLLYVLMAKIALPRIGAIFAERSEAHRRRSGSGADFKEQSDAAHAAYEKALADARARAQVDRQRDPRKAGGRGRGEQQEARGATAREACGGREIDRGDPHAAMGNVGSIADETASAIVERLIGTDAGRARGHRCGARRDETLR